LSNTVVVVVVADVDDDVEANNTDETIDDDDCGGWIEILNASVKVTDRNTNCNNGNNTATIR